jgi:hypothetical protein
MTTSSLPAIAPDDVHAVLARHVLANSTWGGGLTDMARFGRSLEILPETALEIVRKSLKEL